MLLSTWNKWKTPTWRRYHCVIHGDPLWAPLLHKHHIVSFSPHQKAPIQIAINQCPDTVQRYVLCTQRCVISGNSINTCSWILPCRSTAMCCQATNQMQPHSTVDQSQKRNVSDKSVSNYLSLFLVHPSKPHFGFFTFNVTLMPSLTSHSPHKLPPSQRICLELLGRLGFCPDGAGEPAFCMLFWCPWWTHSYSPPESYRSLAYSRKMNETLRYMDLM